MGSELVVQDQDIGRADHSSEDETMLIKVPTVSTYTNVIQYLIH